MNDHSRASTFKHFVNSMTDGSRISSCLARHARDDIPAFQKKKKKIIIKICDSGRGESAPPWAERAKAKKKKSRGRRALSDNG